MIESSLMPSEPMALPDRPLGRIARSVLGYSLLTALMIVTPMLVFVPAALLHCAIRYGRRAGWAALGIGLAVASLYVAQMPATDSGAVKMAWTYLAAVALAIALPSMIALPLVERGAKFGRLLVLLLIGSIAGLAVTEVGSRELLSFSPHAAQVAQAEKASAEVVKLYQSKGMPSDAVSLFERWLGYSTFVLPGILLINISLVFILSLLMLGRLKAWRELAARRADSEALGAYLFRNFALPDWLLFAFVLGGLTPLASGMLQKVVANMLAVVAFLYILQGLAVFRFVVVAMEPGFGKMMAWVLLGLMTLTGVGPLLLGVAGLFDPFFDFRHFKKRKDDSNESHSD